MRSTIQNPITSVDISVESMHDFYMSLSGPCKAIVGHSLASAIVGTYFTTR
jgi:hypothetical protein